jgi:hypothetical protein
MDAWKRDAELAKRDYAVALAAGNFDATAEAQARQSTAAAQLVALENSRYAIEEENRRLKEQPVQQQERQLTPQERFETYIGQFSARSQAYLRNHPEYAIDPRLNSRLIRAHSEAVDEAGIVPDSDAYFRFLDDRMVPPAQPGGAQAPRARGAPAAPVSRQPMNGNTSAVSGSVTLSPAEREAARISGVSEIEYAKHMLAAEAAGHIVRH